MATEKIKRRPQWTYLRQVTGNTQVDISSLEFDELMVQIDVIDGNKALFILPKVILSASNNWFRQGGYGNSSSNQLVIIRASLSVVNLTSAIINNNDNTASSVVQVFYR